MAYNKSFAAGSNHNPAKSTSIDVLYWFGTVTNSSYIPGREKE